MPVLSPEEFERIDKLLATRRPTTPVPPAPVAEESIPISQYPAEILKGGISGYTAELADLALRKGLHTNVLDPATEGWGPYHVGYGLGAVLGLPNWAASGSARLGAYLLPKAGPLLRAAVAGGLANAPIAGISAAVQDEDILPATVRGGVLGAGVGAAGSKLEPLLKHYFGRLAPSYATTAVDEAVPPGTPPPVTETVAGLPPRTPPPEVTPPTGPRPTPTPRETFAEAQARAQETLANAPPVPPLQRPFGPTRMPPPRTPPPETPEAPVSPTIASTRTKKGSGRTYEETVNPPPPPAPPVPAMGLDPTDLARLGEETRLRNLRQLFPQGEEGLPELPTQSFSQAAVAKVGKFMDEQFPDTIEKGVQTSNAAERDWVRSYVAAVTTGQKPPKLTVDPFFKQEADRQIKDLRVSLKQQAETPRTQSGLGTRAVPTATAGAGALEEAPAQMTMPPTPVRLTNVVSQGLAPGGEAFERPRTPVRVPPVEVPEPTIVPEPTAIPEPLPLPDEGLPQLPGFEIPEATPAPVVTPEPVVTPAPVTAKARSKKVDLTKAATLPIETTEPIQAALEALNPIRKELGVKQTWAAPLSTAQMIKQLQREEEEGTQKRLAPLLNSLAAVADVPGMTTRLGKPYGPLIETLAKNWEKASTSFDPTAYRLSLAQKEIPPWIRNLLTSEGQEAKKQRAAIQLAKNLRTQLGIEGAETKAGVIPSGQFAGLSDIEKEAALPGGRIQAEATAEISQAIEQLVGPERAQQLVQLVNTATDDKTLISRATALFKTALPAAIAAAGVTALQPDVAQAIQQEAPKLQNDPAATYLKLNDMGHTGLTMEDVEQALHTQVSPAKKKAVRKLTPQAKKTYLDLTTTEEDLAA